LFVPTTSSVHMSYFPDDIAWITRHEGFANYSFEYFAKPDNPGRFASDFPQLWSSIKTEYDAAKSAFTAKCIPGVICMFVPFVGCCLMYHAISAAKEAGEKISQIVSTYPGIKFQSRYTLSQGLIYDVFSLSTKEDGSRDTLILWHGNGIIRLSMQKLSVAVVNPLPQYQPNPVVLRPPAPTENSALEPLLGRNFCTQCGAAREQNAIFCSGCGKRF